MKISQAFPSNYIKCADLQGRPARVKMNCVKVEDIGDDTKPVLYFIGKEKGLVLNQTNANVISMIYGDDTDNWAGGEIEIYPTETDYQGKRVDAIRVRMAQRQPDQIDGGGFNSGPTDHIAPNARQRADDQRTAAMDDEIPF